MSFVFHLVFSFFMAHAQLSGGYVGVHAGATDSTGPEHPKQVSFAGGARAGWIFYDHIGLGGFVHYYGASDATGKLVLAPVLAEVMYYPFHSIYDPNTFHISALFGTTHLETADVLTGRHVENATTFGWTIGYSIFLQPRYNLGPEVHYFYVFGSDNFKYYSGQISFKILF